MGEKSIFENFHERLDKTTEEAFHPTKSALNCQTQTETTPIVRYLFEAHQDQPDNKKTIFVEFVPITISTIIVNL